MIFCGSSTKPDSEESGSVARISHQAAAQAGWKWMLEVYESVQRSCPAFLTAGGCPFQIVFTSQQSVAAS